MKKTGLITALICLSTLPSMAQDRTETVKFDAGASSKTISGKIKGYDGVSYILGANAGQVMRVLFKPSNLSCYMNVYWPGEETAVVNTEGSEYSATLGKSGNYRVQVFLMRNAARRNETCSYKISFEISG